MKLTRVESRHEVVSARVHCDGCEPYLHRDRGKKSNGARQVIDNASRVEKRFESTRRSWSVVKSGVVSRLIFPVCFVAASLSSCSLVVDANRVQCSKTSECTARGGAFVNSVCIDSLCQPEPKWKCLSNWVKPPTATGKFQVEFLVRHLVNQKPLPGVKAKLCRKLDVACTDALSDVAVTDEAGKVALSVDANFEGYARFEGSSIASGLYFFNPPVISDLPTITVSIGGPEVIAGLAFQAGAKQEMDRGVALISVRDCQGAVAAGVVLTSSVEDERAVTFYSQAGLPTNAATQTDEDGYGGLLNAGAGTHTFDATLAATGQHIGKTTLLIQSGALTFGSVVPDGT